MAFSIRHTSRPGISVPGRVDHDDHAAQADMDAHGAMQAVRQVGGRIGDMPPMRLDCATGLTPQGGKRPRSIRPGGRDPRGPDAGVW